MGGLESLGIDLPRLIAQLITFLILFGLLIAVAYKPFMRMLDERSNKVRESVENAEKAKKRVQEMDEEYKQRMIEATKEAQKITEEAVKTGEAMKKKALEEARAEAEALRARAKEAADREREEAMEELSKEFADLTILAAEKVIRRSLDKEAHKDIIDEVLKEALGRS